MRVRGMLVLLSMILLFPLMQGVIAADAEQVDLAQLQQTLETLQDRLNQDDNLSLWETIVDYFQAIGPILWTIVLVLYAYLALRWQRGTARDGMVHGLVADTITSIPENCEGDLFIINLGQSQVREVFGEQFKTIQESYQRARSATTAGNVILHFGKDQRIANLCVRNYLSRVLAPGNFEAFFERTLGDELEVVQYVAAYTHEPQFDIGQGRTYGMDRIMLFAEAELDHLERAYQLAVGDEAKAMLIETASGKPELVSKILPMLNLPRTVDANRVVAAAQVLLARRDSEEDRLVELMRFFPRSLKGLIRAGRLDQQPKPLENSNVSQGKDDVQKLNSFGSWFPKPEHDRGPLDSAHIPTHRENFVEWHQRVEQLESMGKFSWKNAEGLPMTGDVPPQLSETRDRPMLYAMGPNFAETLLVVRQVEAGVQVLLLPKSLTFDDEKKNYLALPGGFVRCNGSDPELPGETAAREFLEEVVGGETNPSLLAQVKASIAQHSQVVYVGWVPSDPRNSKTRAVHDRVLAIAVTDLPPLDIGVGPNVDSSERTGKAAWWDIHEALNTGQLFADHARYLQAILGSQ